MFRKKAKDPILPLGLFKEPIFTLGSVSLLLVAIDLFGVISFLPLFLQAVIGMSATYSGELLIPLMIGAVLGSIGSGFALKRIGYRPFLISGPIISGIGLYLMPTMHVGTSMLDTVPT